MPTYTLRPNGDGTNFWTSTGANAWSVLDDNVNNTQTPTTGSDCITVAADGQICVVNFEDISFAANEEVTSVELNVYGKVTAGSKISLTLGSAATFDFTSTSYAWSTTTQFTAIDQAALNLISLSMFSVGAGALEVDATYLTVTTAFVDTNPTFISEGTLASTANLTPPSVTIPTHQTDDILVAVVEAWFPDTVPAIDAIPTPTGWTAFGSQVTVLSPADGRVAYFWKRATGAGTTITLTAGANWSTTGSSSAWSCIVDVYRGCITTVTPMEAIADSSVYTSGTSNSTGACGVEGPKRLGIYYGTCLDNIAFMGGTNLTSAGWTLNSLRSSAIGTDTGFKLAYMNRDTDFAAVNVTNGTIVQAGLCYRGFSLRPPYLPVVASGYTNLLLLGVG